jgi:hypothetical protein
VAVAALWYADAQSGGLDSSIIDTELSIGNNSGGAARGSRLDNGVSYYLQRLIPNGWRVERSVMINSIYGLHLRSDVVGRKADIVILDSTSRVMALVSSKFTWRSDRGTEAAQMVYVQRYRPDLPYALVTAEFPRAVDLAHESVEDIAIHLCSSWVAAWRATQNLADPGGSYPTLVALEQAAATVDRAYALPSIPHAVENLKAAARYG